AERLTWTRLRTGRVVAGAGAGDPFETVRGAPRIAAPPSPEAIRRAALSGADWLVRGQKADGTFPYQYLPNRDLASDTVYRWTRHAGAAWTLAVLGHRF